MTSNLISPGHYWATGVLFKHGVIRSVREICNEKFWCECIADDYYDYCIGSCTKQLVGWFRYFLLHSRWQHWNKEDISDVVQMWLWLLFNREFFLNGYYHMRFSVIEINIADPILQITWFPWQYHYRPDAHIYNPSTQLWGARRVFSTVIYIQNLY